MQQTLQLKLIMHQRNPPCNGPVRSARTSISARTSAQQACHNGEESFYTNCARSSFVRKFVENPWKIQKRAPFGGLNRTEERFKDLTKSNDNYPSSASYSINRFGDKMRSEVPTASFASTTKRFKIKENNNPTATAYFPRRQSYSQLHNTRTKSREASSREEGRNCEGERKKSIFCQGNYDIGGQSLADQSMREAIIKKTLKGAFGTNCPRELKLLPPSSRGDLPGPGSYDYQVSNQPPVSVYGNSVFTSRSHRIGLQRKDQISFPAPADYMIDHFSISRDTVVNKNRLHNRAFCSAVSRDKSETINNKTCPYSPGPAAYTVKKEVCQPVQMANITLGSRTERFDEKDNGVPPATQYHLHDSVMNTLLKRTYNVEMNMNLSKRHRQRQHNYKQILNINFIK